MRQSERDYVFGIRTVVWILLLLTALLLLSEWLVPKLA